MAARKNRLGILGVAKINERIFPSFARMQRTELVGIASRSLEKSRQSASRHGIPKAYGSYEEMLKDPEIDTIYNPLPNHLHAEWTRKAADHGKHVLCEKPLAPTAGEAQDLVAYCEKKKVKLMDGFMWPHHPRTLKIKSQLQNGLLGDLLRVQGSFTFAMDDLHGPNIRLKPEMGGGSLLDVGCYPVYGIRWAKGAEPVKALAKASFHRGVDVEMSGVLTFADGSMASFDCGFTMPLRMQFEIVGTTGVLSVPNMWLPETNASWQILRNGTVEHHVLPGYDQIALMHDHFSAAILDGTAVLPNPMEAVKTLKVLDALALSSRLGREVTV